VLAAVDGGFPRIPLELIHYMYTCTQKQG
jgi:hypothetical protein